MLGHVSANLIVAAPVAVPGVFVFLQMPENLGSGVALFGRRLLVGLENLIDDWDERPQLRGAHILRARVWVGLRGRQRVPNLAS